MNKSSKNVILMNFFIEKFNGIILIFIGFWKNISENIFHILEIVKSNIISFVLFNKIKTKKCKNLSKKADDEIYEWTLSNALMRTSWIDQLKITIW
jgi:hypothetical protein